MRVNPFDISEYWHLKFAGSNPACLAAVKTQFLAALLRFAESHGNQFADDIATLLLSNHPQWRQIVSFHEVNEAILWGRI